MNKEALMQKLDQLLGKSPARRYYLKWAALFGGILAVFMLILYFLVFNYSKVKMEAQNYHASIQRMESFKVTASNYARRLEEIKREAESEAARYMEPTDIPAVISHVSKMALLYKVTLKKVNSLPAAAVTGFEDTTRLPLVLEVSGNYSTVGDFVMDVRGGIPWFSTLDKIRIKPSRVDGTVDVSMEMSYYSRSAAK